MSNETQKMGEANKRNKQTHFPQRYGERERERETSWLIGTHKSK